MNLNSESECNQTTNPAVELAKYAQTLTGERIVVPVCEPPATPLQAVIEREAWEQMQREREQALLEDLLVEMRHKARQRRRCFGAFAVIGGPTLALSLLLSLNSFQSDSVWVYLGLCALALTFGLCGIRLHSQFMDMVAYLPTSDVRAVGPLLDALPYADMQHYSQRALQELLPQITPADAPLFSDAHRRGLCRALSDSNSDLVVLTLRALEKIGDGRAVGIVAALAEGQGRARGEEHIQAAARRCLPILEARAAQDAASQTLLRPSQVFDPTGAHLLRPCEGTTGEISETKARELLRAAPLMEIPHL